MRKTALFKQAFELLSSMGYSVVLVSPLEDGVDEKLRLTRDLISIASGALGILAGAPLDELVEAAFRIAVEAGYPA